MAVPLKYLSNFWRSLEMPLINCKIELSLKWYENCILSSAGTAATFAITDTKLYVPVVTLKTEGNARLSKLLSEGFKRPVYWNKYNIIPKKIYVANNFIREILDASFEGVNRLFVLVDGRDDDDATENSYRIYFLPRITIKITTPKLMEEIFMINQLMTRLNNTKKLERYQQDKDMITPQAAHCIMLILKTILG